MFLAKDVSTILAKFYIWFDDAYMKFTHELIKLHIYVSCYVSYLRIYINNSHYIIVAMITFINLCKISRIILTTSIYKHYYLKINRKIECSCYLYQWNLKQYLSHHNLLKVNMAQNLGLCYVPTGHTRHNSGQIKFTDLRKKQYVPCLQILFQQLSFRIKINTFLMSYINCGW